MLSHFQRDALDEISDLIESVSEGFPTYLFIMTRLSKMERERTVGMSMIHAWTSKTDVKNE